jgi:hypothetical protein
MARAESTNNQIPTRSTGNVFAAILHASATGRASSSPPVALILASRRRAVS